MKKEKKFQYFLMIINFEFKGNIAHTHKNNA